MPEVCFAPFCAGLIGSSCWGVGSKARTNACTPFHASYTESPLSQLGCSQKVVFEHMGGVGPSVTATHMLKDYFFGTANCDQGILHKYTPPDTPRFPSQ